MKSLYDVIVVGGRVAGASTAMLLARAGLRVALLERSAYGSDTLSTHALMRAGVLQLSRWGVLPDVLAAGTPPVERTLFHYAGGDTVQVSIRSTPGVEALYAPRRHLLDRILVDAAGAAGVDVRHGVTVTGLLRRSDGRVGGVRALDERGRSFELRGRHTVGADGIRSVVAAGVGAPVEQQAACGAAVLYRYHSDLDGAGYEWAFGDGAAAGMISTDDGLTGVFVSTTPGRMRQLRRGGADGAFDELFAAAAPDLLSRMRGSTVAGRLHGWGGVPGFVRRSWGRGWALVGDAGYFKDPITAHGMTDALRDAELLADAIIEAAAGDVSESTALSGYQARRDALSARLFDATDRVAGYEWDMPLIRRLLREVSASMTDEVEALEALPVRRDAGPPVATAGPGDVLARR